VMVSIDGHEAKVPTTVAVNPGTHSVIASRGDAQVFKRDVTMSESMSIEVEIDAPSAAVTTTPTKTEPVTTTTSDSSAGGAQRTWGWIGVGAGAVFAVGAIGAWAYSGSLADGCNVGEKCESSVRTWETLSAVSVGVAVLATGVGVTLLLTAPKEKTVAVKAGTNGIFLVGEF